MGRYATAPSSTLEPRVAAVSAIIPVRNAESHLAMCLQALRESNLLPAEVIVVDDASDDRSAEVAASFGARVLRLPERSGPAVARNAGAQAAGQPVLMFLDSDVAVHPDTIELAELALLSHGVGAVFGAYDDAPSAPGLVSQYRNLLHHFTHSTAAADTWTFRAGCGAIRRDLFFRCGGFDEQYRNASVEDIELGLRLSRGGVRLLLDPQIQVCHLKRWNLTSMIRTDVLLRAWPWSRLLLRFHRLPADLNLSWRQRAGALFAWLFVLLAVAGIFRETAFVGALGAAAAVAVLNGPFFGFLVRVRGVIFALEAFPLHVLFLLYSSATFLAAVLTHFWQTVRAQPAFARHRGPGPGI